MEESNKTFNSTIKSPITKKDYNEFINIIENYNQILVDKIKEINYNISYNDIKILESLIKESIIYSSNLLNETHINESKNIIDLLLTLYKNLKEIIKSLYLINQNNNNCNQNKIFKSVYLSNLELELYEIKFKILLNYDKDYNKSEEILEKIIKIQKDLNFPYINLVNSIYLMAIIKFYKKEYDLSKDLCFKSLQLIDNEINENYENFYLYNKTNNYINNYVLDQNVKILNQNLEKKIIKYISNNLELLSIIFTLKKDYKNTLKCIKNCYNLNIDKNKDEVKICDFFKNKFDNIKDEIFNYNPSIYKNKENEKEQINNGNENDEMIILKGNTKTFSFKIYNTKLLEPLLISFYRIKKNKDEDELFTSNLFIRNLCFDKKHILNFLHEDIGNNDIFYKEENLNKILNNIYFENNKLLFKNLELKNSILNL